MSSNPFSDMRVAVISPVSKVEPQWVRSLVNMMAYSWAHGLKIYEMGMITGQVVHWARDELVKQALSSTTREGPYTHFLFSDSDHTFPAEMACRLATHFQNPGVDMCSAVYYARNGDPLPVVYIRDPSRDDSKYMHYPIVGIPECLCEVDAVGFGAILIRREVFEALPVPRFRFDGCGEDIFFCVNAKAKGFRVFVDGSLKIGHIRDPEIVTYEHFERHVAEHKDDLGERIKIRLGGNGHGEHVEGG